MLNRNHSKSKQQAFTLIEILIALVIIALATTALMVSISSSIGQVEHLRNKTEAHFVAQNVLNALQMKLLKMKLANGKMSDIRKMGGREWYWTITVTTETLKGLANIQIFKIKVDVAKKDQKEKIIDSITSYAPIYTR